MIVTLEVPDLWVSDILGVCEPYTYTSDEDFVNELKTHGCVRVGYCVLSCLETQKVDLTDYILRPDFEDVIGNTAALYDSPNDDLVTAINNAWDNSEAARADANTALTDAGTAIGIAENAMSIAKGRATGYVFDTVDDMNDWLSYEADRTTLVLGDNLYIRAKDVPDFWWDGTSAQELETQKVDLTEYVKKEELNSIETALDNIIAIQNALIGGDKA